MCRHIEYVSHCLPMPKDKNRCLSSMREGYANANNETLWFLNSANYALPTKNLLCTKLILASHVPAAADWTTLCPQRLRN